MMSIMAYTADLSVQLLKTIDRQVSHCIHTGPDVLACMQQSLQLLWCLAIYNSPLSLSVNIAIIPWVT